MVAEEIVIPFSRPRAELPALGRVRSTLLSSSLATIRDHGHAERYFALIPEAHRDTILSLVAGMWIDVELAHVHYRTCDAMGLTAAELAAVGADVAHRIHGSVLATVIRMASTTGVTMWTGLAQFQRLYERLFTGGGVCVAKLGPKDARVELAANSLCGIDYFRSGLRSTVRASCELFARTVFVKELSHREDGVTYKIAWA
jgi:hypothetical protein